MCRKRYFKVGAGLTTPAPQPQQAQQEFNRANFILLNNHQLFTAKQVADIIQQYTRPHSHTGAPSEERIGSIRTNVFMDEQKEWLIERVNAGMGEWEYVMSYLGEYFATAPSELIAKEIQEAYSDRATIAAQARNQTLKDFGIALIKEIEASPNTWKRAPITVCKNIINSLRSTTPKEQEQR
jgi:hypothetical protein